MKTQNFKWLAMLALASVLTACGGDSGTTSPTSDVVTTTPIFMGAYNGDGQNLSNTADNSCPMVPQTGGGQVQWGKNVLLVNSQNVGYHVCGYRLWTGALSGNVTYNTKMPATPASGFGQFEVDYYPQIGATKTTSAIFSGNIVTVSGSDLTANTLDLKNSGNNTFKFTRLPSTVAKIITNNYATFAGTYGQVDWSLLGLTSVPVTDTLTVNGSGALTGMTQIGQMSGTIAKFDAKTGVHDVTVTVTPSAGLAYTMTGVIGPGPTTSGDGNDFTNVTLALTGGGKSYASVFRKK